MKRFLAMTALTAGATLSGLACAHGEAPRHGGIVRESGSGISLELVSRDGKATIYVEDHGKPVPTAGASGRLTVLSGGGKSEVPLEPAGGNMLVSAGDAGLRAGARAVAAVTLADRKTASVRFVLK